MKEIGNSGQVIETEIIEEGQDHHRSNEETKREEIQDRNHQVDCQVERQAHYIQQPVQSIEQCRVYNSDVLVNLQ